MKPGICIGIFLLFFSHSPGSRAESWLFNNPYPAEDANKKIFYSSFDAQPKTLDPARSYVVGEHVFIAQIYEPILQYNYFTRPYQLEPLTAAAMPTIRYLDIKHQPVSGNDAAVAFSVYTIHIKPGIYFQPHPAFAKNAKGDYRYLQLSAHYLKDHHITQLSDFKFTGTRQLLADDYLYQIKRLASPAVSSPISSLMGEHIVGFENYAKTLPQGPADHFIDLRQYPLEGLKKIDDYTFEITLYQEYAQFMYWLAMSFFAPIPWEADQFYAQAGMSDKNISFDWYPVGTGPFMLSENNPNRRIVLNKNPNFHVELFPSNGSPKDKAAGYAEHSGQVLPFVDQAVYTLEKESIPRWNKFLQGYYDNAEISTDSYHQAVQLDGAGNPIVSASLQKKHMQLTTTVEPTIFYTGFNMLDPIVGGYDERARKLRLAISIAINCEENIAIFYNGRGRAAQGPIPLGIFGLKEGKARMNPYVYQWKNNKMERRSLEEARQLMKEAGYEDGIDPATGEALLLHYDVPVKGTPDDKPQLDWIRKQFSLIGIDLDIRDTQFNRFNEKIRSGNTQLFHFGWVADYPDPENFLFLLTSGSGKVAHGGENAANYSNPTFDRLFEIMKNKPNGPERQQLIDEMLSIIRHDAPWVWGVNTESLMLQQQWVSPSKPNPINFNPLKYISVNVAERNRLREAWNHPVLWPIGLMVVGLLLGSAGLWRVYRKKEHSLALRLRP